MSSYDYTLKKLQAKIAPQDITIEGLIRKRDEEHKEVVDLTNALKIINDALDDPETPSDEITKLTQTRIEVDASLLVREKREVAANDTLLKAQQSQGITKRTIGDVEKLMAQSKAKKALPNLAIEHARTQQAVIECLAVIQDATPGQINKTNLDGMLKKYLSIDGEELLTNQNTYKLISTDRAKEIKQEITAMLKKYKKTLTEAETKSYQHKLTLLNNRLKEN